MSPPSALVAPSLEKYYALTLVLALFWLVVLASAMTELLELIGGTLGFTETVMGLTLGAAGTSFPNLYASVVTARQGDAKMAISQARFSPPPPLPRSCRLPRIPALIASDLKLRSQACLWIPLAAD